MILEKAKKIEDEYNKISEDLSNPEVTTDHEKLQKLSKRQAELEEVITKINRLKKVKEEIKENQEIIDSDEEKEMKDLALEDLDNLKKEDKKLEKELELEFLPKDPNDDNSAIVEIRAGVGGDEAELFAADLYRMYNRYAANKGFAIDILNSSRSELGGLKEVIFSIKGDGAYGIFKYESGVHRVQRVPETEKGGRIHTSTATVAVLPETNDAEIEIKPEDLEIETFRSSGPGGQSVNTTDSAVRITHKPTGITATCREKSQHQNRERAMQILKSKLIAQKQEEEAQKMGDQRRIQIGSGMRSEKIRTYNYPQDRITDHRIKLSLNNIEEVLNGNIDELITKLREEDQRLKLENLK